MNFDDVELGDDLPDKNIDVSLDRVKQFTEASGMIFPRFIDHDAARKEGFSGAILPGIMGQGLLAAMIHEWAPGSHIQKLDTVFRSPIPVDSSPICKGAVTDTDDDAQTIEIDLTITNEDGSTGIMGTAIVDFGASSS